MTQEIEFCVKNIDIIVKRYANADELCSWNIIKDYIECSEQRINDSQDYLTYE
jgi:hypothetical protein